MSKAGIQVTVVGASNLNLKGSSQNVWAIVGLNGELLGRTDGKRKSKKTSLNKNESQSARKKERDKKKKVLFFHLSSPGVPSSPNPKWSKSFLLSPESPLEEVLFCFACSEFFKRTFEKGFCQCLDKKQSIRSFSWRNGDSMDTLQRHRDNCRIVGFLCLVTTENGCARLVCRRRSSAQNQVQFPFELEMRLSRR